ncbi:sensor histidine kinase [Thalassospira sp. MA62]|nr:sensor histidine kinase [Thalassospira sp. MA62]
MRANKSELPRGHVKRTQHTCVTLFPILLIAVMLLMCGSARSIAHDLTNPMTDRWGADTPTAGMMPDIYLLPDQITRPIDLTGHIHWYRDPQHQMTFADIKALPATAMHQTASLPSFGNTDDVIWYRADFRAPVDQTGQIYLHIEPTYMNNVDVSLYQGSGENPVWTAHLGDHVPASLRPIGGRLQLAPMPVLTSGDYTLLVRVHTNGANFLELKLWPSRSLITSITNRDVVSNIFLGIILALGLTYGVLGLLVRDGAVSLYGLWVLTVGGTIAIVKGIVFSTFNSEIPWLNDVILGQTNIVSQAVTVFLWLYLLEFKQKSPIIYRLGCAYGAFFLVFLIGPANDMYIFFGRYVVPTHSLFMALMCLVLLKRTLSDPRNLVLWGYLIVLLIPSTAAIMLQLAQAAFIPITEFRIQLHQITLLFHIIGMGIMMTIRLKHYDEERLTASANALETNQLVEDQSNLISMLSHEFRTPLAVIQRSSEMLMLRLKENPDAHERLNRIQSQARKLARLVDIFLNRRGIGSTDDLSLALGIVELEPFLRDFANQTSRENAAVRFNTETTTPIEADIDETLISLAMANLVETIRRFARGAPIDIFLQRTRGQTAEISIICMGPQLDDIDQDFIENALDPASSGVTGPGNALGLNISQRICGAHGGEIVFCPQTQNGIVFTMRLPTP